jgi:hypothetical protein
VRRNEEIGSDASSLSLHTHRRQTTKRERGEESNKFSRWVWWPGFGGCGLLVIRSEINEHLLIADHIVLQVSSRKKNSRVTRLGG